jgi:hypothetical protein
MAGVINGWVEVAVGGMLHVYPQRCAIEDEHRQDRPVCYKVHPDGWQRTCPYWTATTAPGSYADRRHPTMLRTDATTLGARTINCQVLCQAAKRNRPAGC